MVQVQVTQADGGQLAMLARFEADGVVGSGSAEIGPGESYLGVDFDQWNEHVGRFVDVTEDGSLVPAEP